MALLHEIQNDLNKDSIRNLFQRLYGVDASTVQGQIDRYAALVSAVPGLFTTDDDIRFISTPGRTELGGNHTDHNNGRVLAAAVNIDAVAAVAKTNDMQVTIYSSEFKSPFIVDLQELELKSEEKGSTNALIRGIAAALRMHGYEIGGFKAVLQSDVAIGSGLSSSAVIELVVATIFNRLYNHGILSRMQMAAFGQFAENNFFGKPCGLMDQIACALGGIVAIDFKNTANPQVKRIRVTFPPEDIAMLIIEIGDNHANLTDQYAAIPKEMLEVARLLQLENNRGLTWNQFHQEIPALREQAGDRAIMRVLHFLQENKRVQDQTVALEKGDFTSFFKLVRDSGRSSWQLLQNICLPDKPQSQGLALALALTAHSLGESPQKAWRVHGGGFGGTMQVFLPTAEVEDYKNMIEHVFGAGSVKELAVRNSGTVEVKL